MYFSASGGDTSSSAGNLYDDLPATESGNNKRKLDDCEDDEVPAKKSALRKIMTTFSVVFRYNLGVYAVDLLKGELGMYHFVSAPHSRPSKDDLNTNPQIFVVAQ